MLSLSDADLARLRLECRRYVLANDEGEQRGYSESYKGCLDRLADGLVAWCLRDREVASDV